MSSAPLDTVFTAAVSIDTTAKKALVRRNQRRADALRNSEANGLPAITVSALAGQYLAIQARLIGAESVLEVGTLGGYGTLWLAEQAGCRVTTIELDPRHRDVALQNVGGVARGQVDIILGAALEVMPRLVAEGRVFDMVFVDAAWAEQWEYFDLAAKLTRRRGCIYVDNVVRAMREDLEQGKDLGQESLVARVGRDERVTATLVQTISSHKDEPEDMCDGFLLAIVN